MTCTGINLVRQEGKFIVVQFMTGVSADNKYARSIADIAFWDIIKP